MECIFPLAGRFLHISHFNWIFKKFFCLCKHNSTRPPHPHTYARHHQCRSSGCASNKWQSVTETHKIAQRVEQQQNCYMLLFSINCMHFFLFCSVHKIKLKKNSKWQKINGKQRHSSAMLTAQYSLLVRYFDDFSGWKQDALLNSEVST